MGDPLVNNCRKSYQIAYFLSSTFVTYALLVIATIQYQDVMQEIGFYFFCVMTLISGLSGVISIVETRNVCNYSNTYGVQEVKLKPLNTISSSIMFNELIVPVTFVALAFHRSVITTIAIILFYQVCQYQVFKGDGFMPNLTFELAGLKAYEVVSSKYKGSRLEYVFARKEDLDVGMYGTAVNLNRKNATVGVVEPKKKGD